MTTVPILPWHLPCGHQKTPNFRVCSDVAGDAWREKRTWGWKCNFCLRRWVWYRKTLHSVHPGRWTAQNLQNHPFSFGTWSSKQTSMIHVPAVHLQGWSSNPSSTPPAPPKQKKVTFGGVIEALASKLGLPSAHLSEVGRNGRWIEKGTTVGDGRTQAQG